MELFAQIHYTPLRGGVEEWRDGEKKKTELMDTYNSVVIAQGGGRESKREKYQWEKYNKIELLKKQKKNYIQCNHPPPV